MALEDEKELVARAWPVKGLTVTLDTARRLHLMVDYSVWWRWYLTALLKR